MFPDLVASQVTLTNARGLYSRVLAEFVVAAILYFAKRYKSDAGVDGDLYQLKTYDLRYGADEGALPVALPADVRLNSPGDITCSSKGRLMAFSNAVNVGGKRKFQIVLLLTNMPGK